MNAIMHNAIMENAIGGLIANEAHGLIGLLLCRVNQEIKLAWGFKTELKELQEQLTILSELLKGAFGELITNPLMLGWLKKIKDAAEEADDLVDEWSYETLKGRVQTRKRDKIINGITCPFSRYTMTCKARDLRKLINNIFNDGEKLGIKPIRVAAGDVYCNKPLQDNQERRLLYQRQCVGGELLLGRDEDITKLVNLLCNSTNNSDLHVIGIVGLAGLGKTALSKRVSKMQEVTNFFNSLVIWLVISHSFDLLDALNRMVEILFGKASNMKDKEALVLKLHKKLKGKRYLLVLDDVWDTMFWESLRSSLLEIGGSKGTAILVTSRDRNVVEKMETYNCDDSNNKITINKPFIYPLEGLSKGDSWSLFMARISDDYLASNGKRMIAKSLMKKCRGVPLAIQALGDLLRGKSSERWNEIEKSHLWTTEDEHGILPSLKLSFDYLPSMAVKKCFSYCAIFGEDEVIRKDQLIYMWMAHGFLQPYDEMELTGNEYFKILLNSSLFQEAEMDELGNVTTFKMHDLVLSLARDVSTKESSCLNKCDGSSEIRHFSTSCPGSKLNPKSCKKLQTCLTDGSMHRLHDLMNYRKLRVLRIRLSSNESVEWGSLCDLIHLRYLHIVLGDYSELRLPEQIAKLYHLQTLWIALVSSAPQPIHIFLPKEIGNLVNLRHIRVDHGDIDIPALGSGHLTALQTLPVIALKEKREGRLGELGKVNNLRGTLEIQSLHWIDCEEEARSLLLGDKSNLERLVLKWKQSSQQRHQNAILEVLQPHENLVMLELYAYCGTRLPKWLTGSSPLHNLVSLKLSDCSYLKGKLELTYFRWLRFLSVMQCDKLTISFPTIGLQCCKLLEVVEVDDCYKIENMQDLTPLTKLRILDIRVIDTASRCELVGLGNLTCLRTLRTNQLLPEDMEEDSPLCKSLHSLLLVSCTDDCTKTLPAQLQHCVALRNLKISGFRSVETLPEWLGKLTSLRDLKLEYLAELKHLPSVDAMRCLTNLTTFSTYKCPILSKCLRSQTGEWFKISHICGEIWDDLEPIPGFSSQRAIH